MLAELQKMWTGITKNTSGEPQNHNVKQPHKNEFSCFKNRYIQFISGMSEFN